MRSVREHCSRYPAATRRLMSEAYLAQLPADVAAILKEGLDDLVKQTVQEQLNHLPPA